jgi:hypothetical protein
VGYLEEQAVITYTNILEDLDAGKLPKWKSLAAPEIAVEYWRLPEGSTMRDVLLAIRLAQRPIVPSLCYRPKTLICYNGLPT